MNDTRFHHVTETEWDSFFDKDAAIFNVKDARSIRGLGFCEAFPNYCGTWKHSRMMSEVLAMIVFGVSYIKCTTVRFARNHEHLGIFIEQGINGLCQSCQNEIDKVFRFPSMRDAMRNFIDYDYVWSQCAYLAIALDPATVRKELKSKESRSLYQELTQIKHVNKESRIEYLRKKFRDS